MQKRLNSIKYFALLCFIAVVGIFFYQTLLFGKLPIPSDALVGLYHPYRDALSSQYPNGIPYKNFLITDPIRQQIPWRKTVIESIRAWKMPLWDAFSFSGAPLLANIQSGALYPLNVLFFMFPFSVAWTLLIISQPLLSGIFLYLFLRYKRLMPLPSLFGAICFAFSGFSIAWLTWGTMVSAWLWTPLSLLAIEKIHGQDTVHKNTWRCIFIFSIASSFFAGHLQIFAYSALTIGAYSVWRLVRRKSIPVPVVHIVMACILTVVTAPLWISIVRWLGQTSRLTQGAEWTHEGFFIPIQHLVQFIVPDFFGNPATLNYWGTWNYGEMVGYIGITGLILAGIGISGSTLFWLVVCIVSLLFAVSSPVSMLPYQLHIPLISSLQPTRLLVIVDFCLSVLAAYGLSGIMVTVKKKPLILSIGTLLVLFTIAWVTLTVPVYFGIDEGNAMVAKRNILLPTLLFILSSVCIIIGNSQNKKLHIARRVALYAIIAVCVFDVLRFGWKFTPFTESKYFFPETRLISFLTAQSKPFRIISTDDRIMPPNVHEYYGLESVSGYDPIHSSRYEEFIAAMERGKPDITPPFGFERIIAPKNIQSPLFKFLNVRYVLTFDELDNSSFQKVFEEGKTKVYEFIGWEPRAYLVGNVLYRTTKQEIIDTMYDPAFEEGVEAVSETQLDILDIPLTTNETAFIRSYKESEILLHVSVEVPRLLVINNIYNSNWHAMVDNLPVLPVRVNYLFFGVVIPAGTHIVTLRYY